MANGHGGARPGAGRKKKTTVEQQLSRRDVVLEILDEEALRELLPAWVELAKTTPSVIYPLIPYLLGSPKQEVNVSGKVEHSVTIADIRKAIGGGGT